MRPGEAIKALTLGLISLYQFAARTVMPPCCRFTPSCSDFAKDAVRRRGLGAITQILGRLARCHPFHPGGFDPIKP